MTPEERRELAERLDRAAALNERTAKVLAAAAVRSRDFVVMSAGTGKLLVDVGEEFEQHGIRWWQLVENPDRVGVWDHLPSGTSGQLGEMLLGIAIGIERRPPR